MNIEYKPLWLIEQIDDIGDIVECKLLTRNIPIDEHKGMFSTGIFTKEEQLALGKDLYNLSKLRDIYIESEEHTYEILSGLVISWKMTQMFKRLKSRTKDV